MFGKNQLLSDIDTLYSSIGLPTIAQANAQADAVIKKQLDEASAIEKAATELGGKAKKTMDEAISKAQAEFNAVQATVTAEMNKANRTRTAVSSLQDAIKRLSK